MPKRFQEKGKTVYFKNHIVQSDEIEVPNTNSQTEFDKLKNIISKKISNHIR